MWALHSSCQQSCLTENSVSLHCGGYFLLLFLILLSTKKVCRRDHKAKLTSQSNAAAHSESSVSTLRGKGALCCCHSAQELSPALHFAAMG